MPHKMIAFCFFVLFFVLNVLHRTITPSLRHPYQTMPGWEIEMFVLYVLAYFLVPISLIYVLLFGDAPRYEDTLIGRTNTCLLVTAPRYVTQTFLPRILHSRQRADCLTACCTDSFERYVMPITYHVLLVTCLGVAHSQLIPRLPELEYTAPHALCPASRLLCVRGLALPPRTSQHITAIYYLLAVCSWLSVYATNAGTITKQTHAQYKDIYPYDNLLFHADMPPCRTCKLRKPARSKHCRICNACVARFDHHCGWMATCIGLHNTRLFIFFLALHGSLLAHGAATGMEVARASAQHVVRHAYIDSRTGHRVTKVSISVLLSVEPMACLLAAVFALSAAMVWVFALHHCRLAWGNCTTNESCKWDAVELTAWRFRKKNGVDIWEALRKEAALEGGRAPGYLPLFDGRGLPVRRFDRGGWENLMEVFLPGRFLRLASLDNRNDDESE